MIKHIIEIFSNEKLISFLNSIKIFTVIYLILGIIIFTVSMYKIFKKEQIKSYYAFIPFLNLYYYSKIVEVKFWLFLIPISNLVILIASTFLLSDRYGLKKWQCILSIFVPYFFLPYIAFSNKQRRMRIKVEPFVQTNSDIDKLENKLNLNSHQDFDVENINTEVSNNYASTIDEKINTIENNAISEDYEDLLYNTIENNDINSKKSEDNNSNEEDILIFDSEIDIIDTFNGNDLRSVGIETKEKEIEENSKKEIKRDDKYKEYQEEGPGDETIAFGGATKEKKIAQVKSEAKILELKCPRCGSSLVGSNGTCPGCGHDVSDYIFENK